MQQRQSSVKLGVVSAASLHAPLYFPCILQGTARNSASGRSVAMARLQRDSADIGRIGFVLRGSENGCI
jgi:hypothetical protein